MPGNEVQMCGWSLGFTVLGASSLRCAGVQVPFIVKKTQTDASSCSGAVTTKQSSPNESLEKAGLLGFLGAKEMAETVIVKSISH